MKPSDLVIPYTWEQRRPHFGDQFLFVPGYYSEHHLFSFPLFKEIFGNDHPLHVEFCSGNGEWVINQAKRFPQVNWVAVEKRFDRARKIWCKMKNQELRNLFVVLGEGQPFTQFYLRSEEVDKIHINFPDPWPKDRHAKHRIVQYPFVHQMALKAKEGAILTLVTDDKPCSEHIQEEVNKESQWSPIDIRHESYGESYFSRLWEALGRDFYFRSYKRVAHA